MVINNESCKRIFIYLCIHGVRYYRMRYRPLLLMTHYLKTSLCCIAILYFIVG